LRKSDLVVKALIARMLGLSGPDPLLARTDKVIE
jgi:hypothetical protein